MPPKYDKEISELVSSIRTLDIKSFVSIPGEDPLYYLTGTLPPLGFFQMNYNTCPFSELEIWDEILRKDVKWVIFKKKLELEHGFIKHEVLMTKIKKNSKLVLDLPNYAIYQVNENQ